MTLPVERPPEVDLTNYPAPYGGDEAINYRIIDREGFNQKTLELINQMADLYPKQATVFELLKDELNERLPTASDSENDPSRNFSYDFESPYGLCFKDVFNIICSFPPTVTQYRLLRQYLF